MQHSHFLSEIDWRAPWLSNWAQLGLRVSCEVSEGEAQIESQGLDGPGNDSLVNVLNSNKGELRFSFVDQSAFEGESTYETFIDQSGCIPTRKNLHDFLNGLSWIKYPQIKTAMLGVQAAQVKHISNNNLKNSYIEYENSLKSDSLKITSAQRWGSERGPIRDALTVFDENGILLQADAQIWRALEAKDWRRLFIDLRPLWQTARVRIFGHALLEKLTSPRPSITGHVLKLRVPQGLDDPDIDAWVSKHIKTLDWATKPFTPIQVLGVPGWWADNELPAFYENTTIFRPKSE